MKRQALLLLAVGALFGAPAQAALYRCGNVFQDRPCDGSAPVAPARAAPPAAAPAATSAPAAAPAARANGPSLFAVACARNGTYAQQVQWKREGGATLENQVGEASGNPELVAVVQSVYGRRGTAPEIRAAVEAECVQRKEAAAAAADQLRLLQEAAAGGTAPAPRQASVAPAAPASPAPAAPATTSAAATEPARDASSAACGALRDQRKDIETRMRAGGSAGSMEVLQNQRRDVEAKLRRAEC